MVHPGAGPPWPRCLSHPSLGPDPAQSERGRPGGAGRRPGSAAPEPREATTTTHARPGTPSDAPPAARSPDDAPPAGASPGASPGASHSVPPGTSPGDLPGAARPPTVGAAGARPGGDPAGDAASGAAPPASLAPALAGLCGLLAGIGLARFSYTPLLPALIQAGWFTAPQAAFLGASNLLGYLAGALLAGRAAARLPLRPLLRGAMLLAALSCLASAWRGPGHGPGGSSGGWGEGTWGPLLWTGGWRVAAGIAGGVLMVVGANAALARMPPARRGLAAGLIFTGVGLGIALSGTLVPLLLRGGPGGAWLGLGALCLALTALAWNRWPETAAPLPSAVAPAPSTRAAVPAAEAGGTGRDGTARRALRGLVAAYALNAVGLVPHMVFLVDFIARGRGAGLAAGAWHWVLFGLGALAGPLLGGRLADRIGFRAALRLCYAVQCACIALPALPLGPGDEMGGVAAALLALSCVVTGACTPSVSSLALGRVQELAPDAEARRAAWATATVAWAVGQAAGAYAMSALFAATGRHAPLFAAGAVALALALAIELRAGRRP
ncbi:YbfB/YjiJ family MFS transporter [Roseomonas sp. NAR14]|uniref:YbfB/YjiJ family MFS transporter n=1 Tax=Roseomonas acroporae TaxID=2937791 RepID=A0A9X2BT98_9PROT|nr:YbfB/YjiJ family MFS transporter [Roseomonas acroporae]